MANDHDEWLKERADELVQKTHARIGTWIEQRKAIIDFAREYAALASHTGEAEPFSKAAIDYNTLTLEFAGKWRGGEKVEAGEVLDWLMTLPRVAAATPAAPGEADAAKKLWETIKILGLSNEKLALQAITAALSHLAPVAAPASVPEATEQLVIALAESKGWLRDYARGVIEDAIDRRHLDVAAPALHPATADLVRRFSEALSAKLAAAEKKYGYSDGWLSPDWMDECRAKLLEHVAKGDPRDVAAYCAFLWHHGESAAAPAPASEAVADKPCSLCDGRGFYGMPGARCEWCKGSGKGIATPSRGDSADAPVQQAIGDEDLIQAVYERTRSFASINILRAAYDVGRAALKGEQPAQPSGSERGEV